jgi:hypothetical protein
LENEFIEFDLGIFISRLNDYFLTCHSRDHYDTKYQLLMRTSRNEKEEEEEKKLDGTRDELGCGMRCEAGSNIDEREIENS